MAHHEHQVAITASHHREERTEGEHQVRAQVHQRDALQEEAAAVDPGAQADAGHLEVIGVRQRVPVVRDAKHGDRSHRGDHAAPEANEHETSPPGRRHHHRAGGHQDGQDHCVEPGEHHQGQQRR